MLNKPIMFAKAVYAQEVSGGCSNVQTWQCGKYTFG